MGPANVYDFLEAFFDIDKDDGFMQMMSQAQFYLTVSLFSIMLITKVIEMVKEKKKKRAVDDRVCAAFHQGRGRNAGEAVDLASSWWPYIAGTFLSLTQIST